MNKRFGVAALLLLALPLLAHASCDKVKSSINAELRAKGVSNYTLEVVPADQTIDKGKKVGWCEGGKKIIYTRGGKAAPAPAPAPAASSGG